MHKVWTIAAHIAQSVYAYACQLDAKAAELIKVPFGVWTCGGQTNHALDGGPDPRRGGAILGEHTWACPLMPTGDILHKTMQPLTISTGTTTGIHVSITSSPSVCTGITYWILPMFSALPSWNIECYMFGDIPL